MVMTSNSNIVTEFFEAINRDDLQKVDQLVSTKAIEINTQNPELKNRTALHIAALKGHYELVCLLVDKHQANVNAEDSDKEIPLQLASDRYRMKVVKFLLSKNSSRREYAEHLLNSDEVEELFQAAHSNNIDKVTELVNAGVDVNAEDVSDFDRSILEVAATRGYHDLVKVIVEFGADLQHEDASGECAYHKAVNNKHDNIANYLLEKGFKDIYDTVESNSDTDGSSFQMK